MFKQYKLPAHAPYSSSGSARWLACPGSLKAEAAATRGKPRETNFYADEGTVAHELLQTCTRLHVDAMELVGNTITLPNGFSLVVDDKMAVAVSVVADYIRNFTAEHRGRVHDYHAEVTCVWGPLAGLKPEHGFGTADIVMEAGKHLIVLDYKHGMGNVVRAKTNSQLMLYHAGWAHLSGKRYSRHTCVVVQPRAWAKRGRPVDEWSFNGAHLERWMEETVAPAVEESKKPDPERNAGAHCKYCAAAGTCKAYSSTVHAKAAKVFTMVPIVKGAKPRARK